VSSTGRGTERQDDDFYETPAWAVRAVLKHLPRLAGRRILEPSAGRGAIVRELIANGASPEMITAVEPNEERAEMVRARGVQAVARPFESYGRPALGSFDLIIMNPPFSLAEQHIRLACEREWQGGPLHSQGKVAALVRLAFLAEGKKRADFRLTRPHDRVELARRPAFINGKTDSCAYAWGLWGEGCGGRFWTHEETT